MRDVQVVRWSIIELFLEHCRDLKDGDVRSTLGLKSQTFKQNTDTNYGNSFFVPWSIWARASDSDLQIFLWKSLVIPLRMTCSKMYSSCICQMFKKCNSQNIADETIRICSLYIPLRQRLPRYLTSSKTTTGTLAHVLFHSYTNTFPLATV